ncbi:SulP family inorganic anion transporter [Kineosporia sp. R_H_3]|uniref:SulP family inorganic anion transporter n=1 Tax=Kineosporia sp. R_H_3 TaxID=1961848 RepID=UPI000B4A8CE7|nr:SulP family inorganic anion transporter [Kineosporia sp. R_H_3]
MGVGLNTGWMRRYRRTNLRADLTAGLVVAALAVPQALGYAVVAHVPVEVGLYTLPPALLAYALFGSSRLLVVGPVSTVSVLSGSLVATLAGGDTARAVELTSSLAVVAGIVLVAGGLLRVGWVAEFLSEPILSGFVTGLVVLIVVGEIPGLLGLGTPQGNVLSRIGALVGGLPDANWVTALVGALALALLFGGSRVDPRVPWSLVVLVAGVVVARTAGLEAHGVALIGHVPSGLHLPQLPIPAADDVPALVTGGLAIGAVGLAEGLAAARLFAARSGAHVDADTELLAHGAADLAAGLAGGMGVAGSLSKTAAAARAGARTQMAGLVAAAAVVSVLLFLAPLVSALPKVVLSAIVVHAVWGLARVRAFARYRAIRRNDVTAATVALVGVLALGPLAGLGVAVAQSILGLVYRSIQVTIDEMGKVQGEKAAWGAVARHPDRKTVDGVLVLRLSGPMFWANAATVVDEIALAVADHPGTRVLILDLEATNQLDTTTVDRLAALLTRLRSEGVDLYLVRVFEDVRTVMTRSGFMADLDPTGRMWHSISAGVRAARKAIRAAGPDGVPVPVLEGPYPAAGTVAEVPAEEEDEVLEAVGADGASADTDEERIAARHEHEPAPGRRPRPRPRAGA